MYKEMLVNEELEWHLYILPLKLAIFNSFNNIYT